jgi:hypothetical protein
LQYIFLAALFVIPGFVEEFPFVALPDPPSDFWSALLSSLLAVGVPAVPVLLARAMMFTVEAGRTAITAAWVWATGATVAIAAGSTEVQPAVVGVAEH